MDQQQRVEQLGPAEKIINTLINFTDHVDYNEEEEKVVKCQLCPATVTFSAPKAWDYHTLVWVVSKEKNWAMSQSKEGIFVCCPDCYPRAFDRSKGGSVGFLRPKFKKLIKPL